jgi:hypothetical protein
LTEEEDNKTMFRRESADEFFVNIPVRYHNTVRLAAVAWIFLEGLSCPAQDVNPAVAPPSKWVSPIAFDKRSALAAAGGSAQWRWLLIDRQFNAQADEQFIHQCGQVGLSADAVSAPQITINYDPGCELLTFHWVRLWRGASALNRLDPAKVRSSRRPLDANELLFGADLAAMLALEDVHPGDIVDYAYSIHGGNPVLDGKFVGEAPAQLPSPAERIVTRVICPTSRKIYFLNHGAIIEPSTVVRSNMLQLTWDFRDMPGLNLEKGAPGWFQPAPWVQLSEFQSWADVNKWALRWLRQTAPLSAELTNRINQWKLLPNPQDRVLSALLFVQEEIANAAPAGASSDYEPSPPAGVAARRAGDPVEKTMLLTALLQALNFDAAPVLVNTRLQNTLANYQPSPTLFNHAIAAVAVDGQTYWLDPVAQFQRGPLAARSWPIYGLGLVIRPGVTALTSIPLCSAQPKTTVSAYFSLGRLRDESALKLITVAEGADADRMRQHYAATPPEDIDQENLSARARYYPQIRRAAPTAARDDPQLNHFETTEFYSLEGLWKRPPNETSLYCRLYGMNVDEAMSRPPGTARATPWALPYPVHQLFHAEVPMDSPKTIALPYVTGNQTVEHPDFFFRCDSQIVGNKLILEYEYRSLSDIVLPAALPSYLQRLDAATALQGFTLLSMEAP